MSVHKHRIVGGLAVVAALSLVGGVVAQFSASAASEPQTISTGTMGILWDEVGNGSLNWKQPIANLTPGATVDRYIDLVNSGSLNIPKLVVSQTNTLTPALQESTGLTVKIESCSVVWNTVDGTCAGTSIIVLKDTNVVALSSPLSMNYPSFPAGSTSHLKFTTHLSASSPSSTQGTSGAISYTVKGSQNMDGSGWGNTGNGGTAPSSPVTVATTAPAVAVAPSNVIITRPTTTSIKADWTDNTDGKGSYVVNYAPIGGGATTTVPVPAGSSSIVISNLPPGVGYEVWIGVSVGNANAASPKTKPISTDSSSGWSTSPTNSPVSGRGLTASTIGNDGWIYDFGGNLSNGTAVDTATKYNPEDNTWVVLKPMPVASNYLGSAATAPDGSMYVYAGFGQNKLMRYVPGTNTWSTLVAPPTSYTGSKAPALAVDASGMVYLFLVDETSRNVLKFNPATSLWTTVGPMPGMAESESLQVGDNVYFFGGYMTSTVSSSEARKYNLTSGVWTDLNDIPYGVRASAVTAGPDGSIYLVGGTSKGFSSKVFRYDPQTNSWSAMPSSPLAAYGMSAVASSQGRLSITNGITSTTTNNKVYLMGAATPVGVNPVKPNMPTNLALTKISGNTQISWTDNTAGKASYVAVIYRADGSRLFYDVTAGQNYYKFAGTASATYSVVAVNSDGTMTWSPKITG